MENAASHTSGKLWIPRVVLPHRCRGQNSVSLLLDDAGERVSVCAVAGRFTLCGGGDLNPCLPGFNRTHYLAVLPLHHADRRREVNRAVTAPDWRWSRCCCSRCCRWMHMGFTLQVAWGSNPPSAVLETTPLTRAPPSQEAFMETTVLRQRRPGAVTGRMILVCGVRIERTTSGLSDRGSTDELTAQRVLVARRVPLAALMWVVAFIGFMVPSHYSF